MITTKPLTASFTVEKFRLLGRKSAQNAKFLDSQRTRGAAMRRLIIPVLALALVLTGCDYVTPPPLLTESSGVWTSGFPADATIGVSFPQSHHLSREFYMYPFEDGLAAAGFTPIFTFADNGVAGQQMQIQNMIDAGAKVIIVNAIDGSQLGDQLAAAKQAGVTIIAYDRMLTRTPNVDIYIAYDTCQVGKAQATSLLEGLSTRKGAGPYNIELIAGAMDDRNALVFFNCAMEVLQPKIDDGTLRVPSGQTTLEQVQTDGWRHENATKRLGAILSDFYGDTLLDGVLSQYDSISRPIIATIEDAGLPTPVVTGLYSEEESIRWIAEGRQYSTIYLDGSALTSQTINLVKQLQQGDKPFTDTTYDNGVKTVPAYLLPPVTVTQENVCTVYDRNTMAGHAAAETPLCKGE